MILVWTGERPASEARLTLQARGYDPAQLGLSEQAVCRIDRRFPVLISRSGHFIEEAFSFLSDVAFVRGSTRSARTLETYAESLLSWLAYAERKELHWRRPTSVMLAGYRDYLLGTDGADRNGARALSRRTVNLRLTVAIEFYKHLGLAAPEGPTRDAPLAGPHRGSRRGPPRAYAGGHDFGRLRVQIYSRRPKALLQTHCRALARGLRNPYRLMWQWALCTGLRTCSLVRIPLKAFEDLTRRSRWGQTIDLVAKGGKIVSIHVPAELIAATTRYTSVERVLVASRRGSAIVESLFLNAHGRPVTSKGFYRALKRATGRLNVSAHPHQARTTFATYMRDKLEAMNQAGGNLDAVKVVQSLLAHADARTTEQYLESIDVPSLDVLQILDELARAALSPEVA
jgi:integrase